MQATDLLNRLVDQPFKPFRLHMSDGNEFVMPYPGMIPVGRSTAFVTSRFATVDGRRVVED